MKRIFSVLMVLVLCGMASAQTFWLANGETSPTITISMFVKATGFPVDGLTITDLRLVYEEYRTAPVAHIHLSALSGLDAVYGGNTGVAKAYGSTGGDLRLDLPPEAVDGGIHTFVKVKVWDADTYADATNVGYAIVHLTPAVDMALAGGNPAIVLTDITGGDYSAATPPTNLQTSAVPGATNGLALVGSEMAADLTKIHGSALTETTGQLAAGFTKYFDIASPTSTMNLITGVTTTTNLTNLPTVPTGWLTADGLDTDAAEEIADAVWNEVLADHVTPGSTGLGIAGIPYYAIQGPYYGRYATERAGDTSTTTTLYLTHTTSNDADFRAGMTVMVEDLANKGQMGIVKSYDAATDTITLSSPLFAAPAPGALIYPCPTHPTMDEVIENGLAFRQIFRILSAVMVGKSSYSGGVVTFTGLDGTTVRATITISGQSRTTVSGLNGD